MGINFRVSSSVGWYNAQLPRETPGLYEVLLRVEVSKDREALSGLANTTERMKSFVRSVASATARRALWRESQGRGCARPASEGH